MNCEKCQDLLSDFLEGSLSPDDRTTLNAHLEECLSCVNARDELDSIVSFCCAHRGEYEAPPNERALWLRIRNVIESEQSAVAVAAVGSRSLGGQRESWWSRMMNRSWELSLPQMAMAVAVIMVAVSLITAFSLQRIQMATSRTNASDPDVRNPQTIAALGLVDRTRQQQLAIEYWNQRVEQRKARWNPQMREAFERNLMVIDQAVADSRAILSQNPHDEVSEEMLNAALNDKMELLKEFSDL